MNAPALVMFRCEPLSVRLSVSSCVARHKLANKGTVAAGTEAMNRAQLANGACRGCELGAAHRKGEPTPAELVVEAPVPAAGAGEPPPVAIPDETRRDAVQRDATEGDMGIRGAKHAQRECPCGVKFTPTGPRSKYHADDCPARPQPSRRRGAKSNGGAKRKPKAEKQKAASKRGQGKRSVPKPGSPHRVTRAALETGPQLSPVEVLELAGFTVRSVPVPKGTMLFVEG